MLTVAKLPDDAYFSGGILANTNRFDAIFEFPPAPIPINPRNETIESGSNRFWSAVLQPDTESRWVFAFSGAGSRPPHSFAPWALRALFCCERCLLECLHAVPSYWGIVELTLERRAQLGFQMLAKIALHLANRISAANAIQLPDLRNVMHICTRRTLLVLVR